MVDADGTLWTHDPQSGQPSEQVDSPGRLTRVAVGGGAVWCVEDDGALWSYRPSAGSWTKATPHRESDGGAFELSAIDVAGDFFRAWVVEDKGSGAGWFWSTADGVTFTFGDAFGFKRISVGQSPGAALGDVWLVDLLDRVVGFEYTAGDVQTGFDTNARQMADVAAAFNGDVWLVGIDGSAWKTSDRGNTFLKTGDGFVAITADWTPWALKADGTLWGWFEEPPDPH
ncbi:hypothetical protein [Actinomadura chibensis]|uniref:Uncharacterized protein n=1 Tax=Actinomadura chibensis TaxID=392828 RepID=A0A5D0NC97_9ACTN|nr:hypothetical protein [Actinomadura chibensis]TYB41815.1 hypothetical protein FXF69_33305 [Actinomadura chibensis]